MQLERRTLPGESPQQVMDELASVIAAAGEEAEIHCRLDRPPLSCDPNARIAQCVREAAQDVTGRAPEESGVGYWMDAAIFAAAGVPTVNFGPSGAGAHEAVEWVDLDSLVTCAQVLIEAARRFASGEEQF
jgi:acetylornithine deacetylase